MYNLTNPAEIKRIMAKYDKNFKKQLGQNFLTNDEVLTGIVEATGITKDDYVLEIGPGIGVLTCKLALAAKKVVAIEIDTTLMPVLADTLSDFDNIEVINEDFMKINMEALIKEKFEGKKIKVAANLPYYITTPIIMKLLEYKDYVSDITVMVQKEVAQRLVAEHNTKEYGAISLAVRYRAKGEITQIVPANNFMPAPKVDSAVVHLKTCEPPVKVKDEKMLFKVIKGGFALRRKTLVNSLLAGASIPKEMTVLALEKLGLSPSVRGEALSLKNYADISDFFVENFVK